MKNYLLLIAISLIVVFTACRDEDIVVAEEEEIIDLTDYADWTDATHGKNADPNYSVVFNQTEVLRFDIIINNDDWLEMQTNLAAKFSSSSKSGTTTSSSNPIWVPCSFKFNDTEWYHVGVRYKGNSSLKTTYESGNQKFSFKLDFDEFEDDYPTIKNQRFYGFKQLNLNNNFKDASLMRDKVAADLFRQFGLVSAQTAFCVVYIDNGTGPQYYGVYALIEEVDDTVPGTQFTDGSGNLYKPTGNAATFANGSYNISQLDLKTNEDSANYSDVKSLYDVINSSERTSNTEIWKASLESVFNVDGFLKYLAVNNTIQNWDTYGNMTHNFYLYNNPQNNLLTWIPWDNNLSFQATGKQDALSLSMNEVGNGWPIISYLIDQSEYEAIYEAYLQQFIDEVFISADMISTYSTYYELIKEYAYAEESGYTFIRSDSEFDQAVETLKTHVQSRNNAVNNYLN